MSHSKGPWIFSSPCAYGRDVYSADGKWVGDVKCSHGGNVDFPSDDECGANAALVAAAPDLYEALKNIENDDGSIPPTIWKMRNDAIAKAEGVQL